jgi:hypothetical protein
MPKARLGGWMSAQSAHDADFRGWSRSPKGRSKDSSASVAALVGQTRFSTMGLHVSLGMATSQKTLLHPLTKRVKNFSQENVLAEIAIVLQNRI